MHGVRFPACLSLRKVAGTPPEEADVLHVAAFEQEPSLDWTNSGLLVLNTSKELLALECSVSDDTYQKPASKHSYTQ